MARVACVLILLFIVSVIHTDAWSYPRNYVKRQVDEQVVDEAIAGAEAPTGSAEETTGDAEESTGGEEESTGGEEESTGGEEESTGGEEGSIREEESTGGAEEPTGGDSENGESAEGEGPQDVDSIESVEEPVMLAVLEEGSSDIAKRK